MIRGDIYLCDLGQLAGHVQSGYRPVIVIQNNVGNQHSPTIIVCGITSAPKKQQPTHCFISTDGGLPKPSTVLCEQIFTVNKTDLKHYLGTVSNPRTLNNLDRCIQISLGLIAEKKDYGKEYHTTQPPKYTRTYKRF